MYLEMHLTFPSVSHQVTMKIWWNKVREIFRKLQSAILMWGIVFLLCVLSHLSEISSKIQGINKLCFFFFMDKKIDAHRDKEGHLHKQKGAE